MDFFAHQDRARRNTKWLVVYFVLAVILIITAVYAVFAAVFLWASASAGAQAPAVPAQWWNPNLFAWVTGLTLLVIVVGTIYKTWALAGGGEAVARSLGAEPIRSDSTEPAERRLLNVVEEIAIASGTPVPRVYVLEEDSINAFAAGFSTRDAVVAVTRGALNRLSRDELQGVIAHEFSHILNGDMRLNIRLIGVLNGILVVGIIGYWILRSALNTRSGRGGKKGNPLPFILLGLAVMIIGYIGVFFGKLIKSAVSRQREFLADAASVQFTRNPAGLSGALKKIGGLMDGSRITHPNAEEASHLFFADGLRASFFNLMATHPPLHERIRRIEPAFDGKFLSAADQLSAPADSPVAAAAAGLSGPAAGRATAEVIGTIGQPDTRHLAYVTSVLTGIPDDLKNAARDPGKAQALILGLLLNREAEPRARQLRYLEQQSDPEFYGQLRNIMPLLNNLRPEYRLPLVDMALAALRALSPAQVEAFKAALRALVEADAAISLFEYTLQRMVLRHLELAAGKPARRPIYYSDLPAILPRVTVVLSTLAYYGRADHAAAAQAFAAGFNALDAGAGDILPPAQCGLPQVDEALTVLALAAPQLKKQVLNACVACISADGQTTIAEAELLRAIADSLDCPIPPLLPSAAAD